MAQRDTREMLDTRAVDSAAEVPLSSAKRAAADALDAIGTAMLIVGPDGTLFHANYAGHAQLQTGGAIRTRAGRVSGVLDGGRLAALIAAAAGGDAHPQRHTAVLRDSGGVLRVVRAQGLPRRTEGVAVLLQVEEGARSAPTAALLGAYYDLTAAEARIALALLAGETLRAAAVRLSICISTARSQLAAVFAKTGTARQSDLVRRLAALSDPFA